MDELPNLDLGGYLRVWWDQAEGRVVFYDFENDEGFSLPMDAWQRAVAWAQAAVPASPRGP